MRLKSHMKNGAVFLCAFFFIAAALQLPGFAADADGKAAGGLGIILLYSAAAVFSLLPIGVYLWTREKQDIKFLCLYVCVAIADWGYLLLAASPSLECALWANRIGYFGSAYAVLTMLFVVLDVCRVRCSRWAVAALIAAATAVFLLAATGGWLNIYYSAVHMEKVNGISKLVKEYAPLHVLYTLYVLCCFGLMTAAILRSYRSGKLVFVNYAVFLLAVVLGNIAVWGVEQLINVDFEFLSISYIVTEVLLMLMSTALRESDRKNAAVVTVPELSGEPSLPPDVEELFDGFAERVTTLTPAERTILQYFIDGCSINEIASKAFISVNTVKKHNTNLNRKLEVGSKEELFLYIDLFRRSGRLEEITYRK